MIDGREHEPGLSLERFYDIAAEGRPREIEAALARFSASARIRNPIAIGLRAMKSVTGGDIPGGVALLKRAVAHCNGHVLQYLLELLVPLLININQVDHAEEALAATDNSVPELMPAFSALRAIVAARRKTARSKPPAGSKRWNHIATQQPRIRFSTSSHTIGPQIPMSRNSMRAE
jgi:hypothetical protein